MQNEIIAPVSTIKGVTSLPKALRWSLLVFLVYLMLLAVGLIGSGFKEATQEQAKALFELAANPVMGLIIGMVCTALIQSSSTVSSIIVAMVAGGLPISIAIPMMMGANIGTSITNTIVSLGHIGNKAEFQRAFNAATIHDFFNIFAVLIFLPLEIMFGIFEHISAAMVSLVASGATAELGGFNPIKASTAPVIDFVKALLVNTNDIYSGSIKIILGLALIIISITWMGKIMKSLMIGRVQDILKSALGKGSVTGISSGAIMTILVQSSSTTTSLLVPLVGNGIVTARSIYPFTLGANIGTCITALIAALAIVGPNAELALQIAFVHLAYNVLSVVVIYGIALLREWPPNLSYKLSLKVADRKIYGLAYIIGLFFLLPLGAVFIVS
ncbi:Na/Pi symporter [Brumicola pallidula]|jgi:sodium-dependent phosphate cotransporter|uniref:Solute carrier family 34 n=1 Tax=Brumicola pallidula DSM 14239 = ACAM 615 TaxID=1121922 RepID=K6YBG1_9ALTE|nr:Na/Pi symporter [Glaciecola pallidula]GAC30079.1 solute carrier family 34 [Glaciecola pallidula DSM 14239 = ACAM 615]